jgi:ABC-type transport system involved in multi-copper enzyme maturation permease subunit
MIAQIAKKEVRHNLYTIRFPALLVISAILFILNGILAVTEPVQEEFRPDPSTTGLTIRREPDMLQFCARGTNADRIQMARVDLGGAIKPMTMDSPASLPSGDHLGDYALPHADRIDWMFIVKMIFSLFAIIFTFDAISGEREKGTLTLMCANSISRSSVLLGKYLGACGTLMIPLMLGVVINLLIILVVGAIAGTVSLQLSHFLRMGLLTLMSIVYISMFVLLGLLVSTSVRRSSTSLLILLAFWVTLVMVLPNMAGIIAEHAAKTESEYQLSKRQRQTWDLAGGGELNKKIDSGKITNQEEMDRAAEELFINMMKIINNAEAEHRAALTAKRRLARRIALASPAAIYQYVGEAVADSGFERQQQFLRSAANYYLIYEDYVKEKVGKVIPNCSWSFSMSRTVNGKSLYVRSPRPEQYKGDMSDFPYFSEQRQSIMDSLRVSLTNLAILFFWNVLFFVAAHYVFVRRSLR